MRSAVAPAPEEGSNPAMVRTTGGGSAISRNLREKLAAFQLHHSVFPVSPLRFSRFTTPPIHELPAKSLIRKENQREAPKVMKTKPMSKLHGHDPRWCLSLCKHSSPMYTGRYGLLVNIYKKLRSISGTKQSSLSTESRIDFPCLAP